MKTRMTALELILHLAEGSTTPNTLQHITKIAREALEAAAQQESVATLYGSLPVYDKPAQQEPEIVQRVKRYAGQTLRTARNPNITARECIELADWLAAHGITKGDT